VYVELLDPVELANKFPWLSTKGVSLASFGFRDEGWFDPWILLSGFKKKTISLGADYISAEVVGVNIENDSVKSVKIQNATEEKEIECNYLVNACGPWAAELALMAGIGKSDHTCHIMRTRLPVEPRLRSVFVFRCPTDLPNSPLVIAKNIYWRRESTGTFLAGYVPSKAVDKAADGVDLEAVDYRVFDEVLWPSLAEWVPAFEELKVQSGWSGYYEYNTLDQNAIIGTHPVVTNYVFANGFSGHGIQMAPGVGRAVSEIILDGNSHSIDLKNFSFQRVLDHEPYGEKLVV
jgi:FAD-dependent oxidoreductase domain-containing protein 1